MLQTRVRPAERATDDWFFVWPSILSIWALNLGYYVLRTLLGGEPAQLLELHRLAPFAVGIAMTFLLWPALRASARLAMGKRLVIAALVSLPAAVAVTAFTVAVVAYYEPGLAGQGADVLAAREQFLAAAPRVIADESFEQFFFFFAWGAFYVAVSSGQRLREAERRAASFESLAQSSQLQALRYQINPHFLFNTLNSLSSLVMTRRTDEAEEMILGLSNFLRATLTTDPTADVTLGEEVALQRLYLDIERTRFPDRLRVLIDIPAELDRARLPALLLQPIVENAIKYGVARARDVVTLRIAAEKRGQALALAVQNSAGADASPLPASGTGVGLANVRQRLAARFGNAASCRYGPLPEGGFEVSMLMPLVLSD